MKRWNEVQRAAVIGSGVMGAAIAAHLANAGIRCLLLDIVPEELTEDEVEAGKTLEHPDVRSRLPRQAIARLKKASPAPLYMEAFAERIIPGNTADHLQELSQVDWIIEAVTERVEVKRTVLAQIERHWQEGTLISSNTSGISLESMLEGRSEAFRRSFVGTHFFNPPRYMHLVELIPNALSDQSVLEGAKEWCERRLGKGVVIAKDTPNFIANRIGTYGLVITLQEMERYGLTIEEVDALTGPIIGRPKSATFRTLDIVGLDTFLHVANNVAEHAETETERNAFALPPWFKEMVERGWLGEKSGQGFYRKVRSGSPGEDPIHALRWQDWTYEPRQQVASVTLQQTKREKGTAAKLRAAISGRDQGSQFIWSMMKQVLCYAASKVGEIADHIEDIDKAMRWGFNWELGPFECWDAIGLRDSVARMRAEDTEVPVWVEAWLEQGHERFYEQRSSGLFFAAAGEWQQSVESEQSISLRSLKEQGRTIARNSGASLIDVGDDVACLEFHSPNNAIGEDILSMIEKSVDIVARDYRGLIVANEGRNFCVGANVMLLLGEAQAEEWDEIDFIIRQFQRAMMKLKGLQRPVVAAPHRMTLGGGVEACLPADMIVFSPESYFGLVETGVGLIPGGGGCKETAIALSHRLPHPDDDLNASLVRAFETIAMAKVSNSGHDALRLAYVRSHDRVLFAEQRRIYEAKQAVLAMDSAGYVGQVQEAGRPSIRVAGREGFGVLQLAVSNMLEGGYISEHDALIARKLARVLTGGDVPANRLVSESHLLDLEREAFLSLCGERKTQQRMQHMLSKGKPLRN
ncbi:3-hydroxyacyl-CoA dehydrogenase/enoyl-CoA hydratase family protein [Paenibacillus alvei]|uniref:Bifunctional enoyl-CoA hydratase / 3-hydroxyacyl-CoA dehydrogenase n=1 Tax=Paenibacillus alvei TaxID=44250 RepID=A0A383R7G0_PAEAL|nr:3-hydroxyacyl-CoA dehydrogenase/enoyl-CoA hydratase family protein [Paenibacillus alvei]SYX82890.1 bifunctional enoyl-CoA hydratase / 3-hydroxyacyl-CoA dehydrogenase [Paenibacillus alvei]